MVRIERKELTLDKAIEMARVGTLDNYLVGSQFQGKTINEIFHLYKKDGSISKLARDAVVCEYRHQVQPKMRKIVKHITAPNGMDYRCEYDGNTGKLISKVMVGYHRFN